MGSNNHELVFEFLGEEGSDPIYNRIEWRITCRFCHESRAGWAMKRRGQRSPRWEHESMGKFIRKHGGYP